MLQRYMRNLIYKRLYTCNKSTHYGVFHPYFSVNSKSLLRGLSSARINSTNPYEILGVSKDADAKQIKLAYFREAKKYHPDLNPGDKSAKANFQKVAFAYEVLSDPTSKSRYDRTGRTSSNNSGTNPHAKQQPDGNAEDLFRSVWDDMNIITDALNSIYEDISSDMNSLVNHISKGEGNKALEMINRNKIFLGSVVIPTVLFLRFPGLILVAQRIIFTGVVPVVLTFLVRTGNLELVVAMIWQAIVDASRRRRSK